MVKWKNPDNTSILHFSMPLPVRTLNSFAKLFLQLNEFNETLSTIQLYNIPCKTTTKARLLSYFARFPCLISLSHSPASCDVVTNILFSMRCISIEILISFTFTQHCSIGSAKNRHHHCYIISPLPPIVVIIIIFYSLLMHNLFYSYPVIIVRKCKFHPQFGRLICCWNISLWGRYTIFKLL